MLGASAAPPAVQVGRAGAGAGGLWPPPAPPTAAAGRDLASASRVPPPVLARPGGVSALAALVLRRPLHRPQDGLGHAGELIDEAALVSRGHGPSLARGGGEVLLQDLQVDLWCSERAKWDGHDILE